MCLKGEAFSLSLGTACQATKLPLSFPGASEPYVHLLPSMVTNGCFFAHLRGTMASIMRGTRGGWRQSATGGCELRRCDARAGSRSGDLHGVSQVNQRLLAHFEDPFLRAVEIRNEPNDHRKGESDGQLCQ